MEEKKSKLYKLVNGIGIYWVIAKDPTEAENKLMSILNDTDYGLSSKRVVTEIHFIADEAYSGAVPGLCRRLSRNAGRDRRPEPGNLPRSGWQAI